MDLEEQKLAFQQSKAVQILKNMRSQLQTAAEKPELKQESGIY